MSAKLNINDALKGINQVNFVTCPIDGVKVSSPKPSKSGIKQEILLEFQTQGSFYEWLRQTWEGIEDGHSEYRMSSKNTTPRRDWDLGVGLDGIKKLHELGWEDGINQLIRASSQFPTAGSQGQVPETDIAGGTLDVPSFLSGLPDHWDIDPDEDSIGLTNLVKIIVPLTCSAHVSTSPMLNRGLAIVSAIKSLTASKKQTEIWIEESGEANGINLTFRVCLKRGCDPISLNDIACWIAHPATFRRMMFQAIESMFPLIDKSGRSLHDGFGSNYGVPSEGPLDGLNEGTVIIPTYNRGQWNSPKASMECLTEVFKSAGYNLEFDKQ